jgi:hypothetical protein
MRLVKWTSNFQHGEVLAEKNDEGVINYSMGLFLFVDYGKDITITKRCFLHSNFVVVAAVVL